MEPWGAVLDDAWNARHFAQRSNVNRGKASDHVTQPEQVRIIKDEDAPLTYQQLKRKMMGALSPEMLD